MRIPRIFHQIWIGSKTPSDFGILPQSWLKHNPDWNYRFWSDDPARNLVALHAKWFLKTYDAWPLAIQRADSARYVLMLAHGGVYADLDLECLRPLDDLLCDQQIVLGLEPPENALRQRGWSVCNAFLASPPGDPFWLHVLELMAKATEVRDPILSTGPGMLSHAVETYTRRAEISIYSWEVLFPLRYQEALGNLPYRVGALEKAFAAHYYAGTWRESRKGNRR